MHACVYVCHGYACRWWINFIFCTIMNFDQIESAYGKQNALNQPIFV